MACTCATVLPRTPRAAAAPPLPLLERRPTAGEQVDEAPQLPRHPPRGRGWARRSDRRRVPHRPLPGHGAIPNFHAWCRVLPRFALWRRNWTAQWHLPFWGPLLLHPRKRRTRAPVLTGGPGAAPGGVASKNGKGHMRVQKGGISYSSRGGHAPPGPRRPSPAPRPPRSHPKRPAPRP